MARPPKNGTSSRLIDYRLPCNPEERARITSDAREAGFSTDTDYGRHLFFFGEPIAKGRGMKRPDHILCLNDLTNAINMTDNEDLKHILRTVAGRHLQALNDND